MNIGNSGTLAATPFVAPLLLARLEPRTRKWSSAAAVLLAGGTVMLILGATFGPLLSLVTGLRGTK